MGRRVGLAWVVVVTVVGAGIGDDFGDFGVSFVATVAGRYTRRGGPRLSVRGEPLIVLTRGPEVPPMQRSPTVGHGSQCPLWGTSPRSYFVVYYS